VDTLVVTFTSHPKPLIDVKPIGEGVLVRVSDYAFCCSEHAATLSHR
jgi:hypothetical protein